VRHGQRGETNSHAIRRNTERRTYPSGYVICGSRASMEHTRAIMALTSHI